jgi:hypothetical protein
MVRDEGLILLICHSILDGAAASNTFNQSEAKAANRDCDHIVAREVAVLNCQ